MKVSLVYPDKLLAFISDILCVTLSSHPQNVINDVNEVPWKRETVRENDGTRRAYWDDWHLHHHHESRTGQTYASYLCFLPYDQVSSTLWIDSSTKQFRLHSIIKFITLTREAFFFRCYTKCNHYGGLGWGRGVKKKTPKRSKYSQRRIKIESKECVLLSAYFIRSQKRQERGDHTLSPSFLSLWRTPKYTHAPHWEMCWIVIFGPNSHVQTSKLENKKTVKQMRVFSSPRLYPIDSTELYYWVTQHVPL